MLRILSPSKTRDARHILLRDMVPAAGIVHPMAKQKPSDESVRVARIAFGRLDASVKTLLSLACSTLGLRRASDYPHNQTHLLLQAAHQRNTQT